MDAHRVAEARSLALHEEIARRIPGDPSIVARALANLERHAASGALHPRYAAEWRALLSGPVDALLSALIDHSERGLARRQASPFAGVLDNATRWQIWRGAGARARRE